MRLKAIHFVNEPAVFGALFAIVKPFLKEKLVKRVSLMIRIERLSIQGK